MYEEVWREKCTRDLPLFPNNLAELLPVEHRKNFLYRIYYLVRSQNCYGRLYIHEEPTFDMYTRIYDVMIRGGRIIILNGDELLLIDDGVVVQTIKNVRMRIMKNWWLLKDSTLITIEWRLPDEPTVTTTRCINIADNCSWVPDGRLVLSSGNTIHGVLEFIEKDSNLYILQNSGTLYMHSLKDSSTRELNGRYIKLLFTENHNMFSIVGIDGRCYELDDHRTGLYVHESHIPLRELYWDVLIAINGEAYSRRRGFVSSRMRYKGCKKTTNDIFILAAGLHQQVEYV